jgi:hypothetical protein
MTDYRDRLRQIRTFPSLVKFLRDDLDWPIDSTDDFEDLTFDYTPAELGIDPASAAKIDEIKRLRPLSPNQPWGIFFVKFEPKQLPVVALRRILNGVVVKKRATASAAEQQKWAPDDLLFISNYGEDDERRISFAHFSQDHAQDGLPTLKVLAWDDLDTPLHLEYAATTLVERLSWPTSEDENNDAWRKRWRSAFELRHREVVTTSKALAEKLALLARAIRDRIRTVLEIETEHGPITKLQESFRDALVHDLDADGFADMYAQTIAYGLLSARVANPKGEPDAGTHIQLPVTNPFLKELMETFLNVDARVENPDGGSGINFDELGVSEVVELLDDANMEAVVRDFGDKNPLEDPVIHFYEHFLKEYDAKKRMQRGVFYTPRPVVSYIVRSVHELLQTDFGLADGLADTLTWGEMAKRHPALLPQGVQPTDPFVTILDPATGTGTFLVEAIDVIHRTLVDKWRREGHGEEEVQSLWNDYVPHDLLPRLHGYELLMAPYAIAHLKIGLKLHETGYRFESDERARIYLTNSLEPAQDFSGQFEFAIPALAHEARAVNVVKRERRFTVVIGNPPYAGHSLNNQLPWIVDKVYDYKRGYPDLQKPGQAKWLQDDYVKFLRFAEWEIERSDCGVVGFITNHAWLDNPTFKGMRAHFLNSFQSLSVLDLHGNANKKEVALDGSPDKNVFEIKQGVSISLLRRVRADTGGASGTVERTDVLGTESHKYAILMANVSGELPYERFQPLPPEFMFASLDEDRKREYEAFVHLPSIMNQNGDPAPGIVTTHDEFAISFSKQEQIDKVEALLATQSEAEARGLFTLCSQNQWVYEQAKRALSENDWRKDLVPILYRPFDRRWTVYSRYVAVHRRERVSKHLIAGNNLGLISVRQVAEGVFSHALVSNSLVESRITISNKGIGFALPLWLNLEQLETQRVANYSPETIQLVSEATGLAPVGFTDGFNVRESDGSWDGRGDPQASLGPRDLFDFIYGILHSESYRVRYANFLKSDFARIPLTPSRELFRELSHLGGQLVALHLMESFKVNDFITSFTGPQSPEVMRVGWSDDTVWLDAAATKKGQPAKPGTVGFRGVREEVWEFRIGGYQVCHKWLKDRKGRTLSDDDIAHYQKIVVAISETIGLMRDIDRVIEEHGGWPDAFALP